MSLSGYLRNSLFILIFLCILLPAASAWNVEKLDIKPASGPLAPQTPVTVGYIVSFSSFMTGTTFESQHSLDMSTDLEGATWTATLVNIDEDSGNTATELPNKAGIRYRVEGWTLSYSRTQLELVVRLKGYAPNVTVAQDKTIIRVQERDEDANVVAGGKTVKYQITAVPPATVTTEAPTTVITTEETPPPTTAEEITPTPKQTYSPGPDPCIVAGMLCALVVLCASRRRNR
jgi:hypothetical protein